MYQLDGSILLLGVSHKSNTSLHLAEHSIQNRKKVQKGTALLEEGQRVWKTHEEIDYDADVFEAIGKEFEEVHPLNTEQIGLAICKLLKQRLIVDFARDYFNEVKNH
jgi:aminoglycoside 3-N-acetyltransferase